MQPWQDISPVSGFPVAFYSVDARFSAQLTALGEILTLPIVVLVTTMALPRLLYAMAEDGMLPSLFHEVDRLGNLWNGTLIGGGLITVIATFVPFENLNDMISFAVLTALSLSDTSLVLLWHESPEPESRLSDWLALGFHAAALTTSVSLTHFIESSTGQLATLAGAVGMISCTFAIWKCCPRCATFGGKRHHYHGDQIRRDDGYFRTPFVPFLPLTGVFINWYLIAQLDLIGVASLLAFLGGAILYYFFYAQFHSKLSLEGEKGEEARELLQ